MFVTELVLLIRPEDIKLQAEQKSPYDLPCHISLIHYQGSHYEIDCNINGISIKVIENKSNLLQQQWHENQQVFLSLKSFRIFEAEEGHQKTDEKLKSLGYIE